MKLWRKRHPQRSMRSDLPVLREGRGCFCFIHEPLGVLQDSFTELRQY